MAKVKNGIFGNLSGKIEDTVFYTRKGIHIAQQDRTTPTPKKFIPTIQKIESQRSIKDRMILSMTIGERVAWISTFGSYDNIQKIAFWASARILETSNPPTSNPRFIGKQVEFFPKYAKNQNSVARFVGYQWQTRNLAEISKGQILFFTFNYQPAPILTRPNMYRYSPTFPFFGFVSTPEEWPTLQKVRCVAIQLITGNYQVFNDMNKT